MSLNSSNDLKINVVGISGTGKSTFSKKLAKTLSIKYIEMDSLHWKDNWEFRSNHEFNKLLEKAISSNENLVLDGNYHRQTFHTKRKYINILIWLDYPFYLVFYRSLKRSIVRLINQEPMWETNNTETISRFFSKENIVLWTIKGYPKMKKRYIQIFTVNPDNFALIRLTSQKEANKFIDSIRMD